jgi:hypothetical protein
MERAVFKSVDAQKWRQWKENLISLALPQKLQSEIFSKELVICAPLAARAWEVLPLTI